MIDPRTRGPIHWPTRPDLGALVSGEAARRPSTPRPQRLRERTARRSKGKSCPAQALGPCGPQEASRGASRELPPVVLLVASRPKRARSGKGSRSRSHGCVMRLPSRQPLTEDLRNLPAAAAIFSAREKQSRQGSLRAADPRWVLCLLRRAWFLDLWAGPGAQVGLTGWGGGGRGVAYVKRLSERGLGWKVEKHPFLLRVVFLFLLVS